MNPGSMGEMPPRTRGRAGCARLTAAPAMLIISANFSQRGSISKSQWDLLFGSFQNMAASIINRSGLDKRLRPLEQRRSDRGKLPVLDAPQFENQNCAASLQRTQHWESTSSLDRSRSGVR